jgi:hypothetical protein
MFLRAIGHDTPGQINAAWVSDEGKAGIQGRRPIGPGPDVGTLAEDLVNPDIRSRAGTMSHIPAGEQETEAEDMTHEVSALVMVRIGEAVTAYGRDLPTDERIQLSPRHHRLILFCPGPKNTLQGRPGQ